VVRFTPRPPCRLGNSPRYSLNGRVGVTQSRVGRFGEEMNLLSSSAMELRLLMSIPHPSPCSGFATPAALSPSRPTCSKLLGAGARDVCRNELRQLSETTKMGDNLTLVLLQLKTGISVRKFCVAPKLIHSNSNISVSHTRRCGWRGRGGGYWSCRVRGAGKCIF